MDFTWTAALLKPLTDGIGDALTAVIPIGVSIMGTLLGINVVRRVIFTFV